MDADLAEGHKVETCILIWDIKLKITNKADQFQMVSPLFSINPNKSVHTDWIQLYRYANSFDVQSTLSSTKELKRCTIQMINPLTYTVLEDYNGFGTFTWNHHEWSDNMRFVFEMEFHCDAPAVNTVVWKHLITEMKPAINTNALLLNLDTEKASHTVENNRGASCVVKQCISDTKWHINIEPETPSKHWNLLTVMLEKQKNNVWQWCYLHTSPEFENQFGEFLPLVVFEIHELITSVENNSDIAMASIADVIKSNQTLSTVKTEFQQLKISSNLTKYDATNKLCDVAVQIGDHPVQVHKKILVGRSTNLRDSVNNDQKLSNVVTVANNIATVIQMFEYLYTGVVKLPVEAHDKMLRATHKYGADGLKEICVAKLIASIDMKNVVTLLVLSEQCAANVLFEKILPYVRENYAAFIKLEASKSMFVMHPELAFKLFAKIK